MSSKSSIVGRLWAAFALIIIGLIVLTVIYHTTLSDVRVGLARVVTQDLETYELANSMRQSVGESRLAAREFLLRRDLEESANFEAVQAELESDLSRLDALAARLGDPDLALAGRAIRVDVEEVRSAFSEIVASWETRGLNEKSGLQGDFRDVVHQLETEFARYHVNQLYESYLLLRRWEKDYHRTQDKKYAQRHEETLAEAARASADLGLPGEFQRELETLWGAYGEAWRAFEPLEPGSQESETEYAAVRDAAHQIESVLVANKIDDASRLLLQLRRREKDYLLRYAKKYVEKAKAEISAIRAQVDRSMVADGSKRQLATLLDQYLESFLSLVAEVDRTDAAVERFQLGVTALLPKIDQLSDRAATGLGESVETAKQVHESSGRSASTALAIALACTTLAIVVGLLCARAVSRPVRALLAAFGKFETGDLTVSACIDSGDEFGQIARAFDRARDRIRIAIGNVVEATGSIGSAAQQLRSTADSTAVDSDETRSAVENIETASEAVKQHSAAIAGATSELSTSIAEITRNTNEAARITEEAVEKVSRTESAIAELSESSDEIGSVLGVISSIAEQTNLLALNATIEAARAGEAGKGFAVVATEVKELATQTGRATEDVGRRIAMIRSSTEGVASAIRQVVDVVTSIRDLQAGIASATDEQEATTQEIARNVETSSADSQRIAGRLAEVSERTRRSNERTEELAASSADLLRTAQALEEAVCEFTL